MACNCGPELLLSFIFCRDLFFFSLVLSDLRLIAPHSVIRQGGGGGKKAAEGPFIIVGDLKAVGRSILSNRAAMEPNPRLHRWSCERLNPFSGTSWPHLGFQTHPCIRKHSLRVPPSLESCSDIFPDTRSALLNHTESIILAIHLF